MKLRACAVSAAADFTVRQVATLEAEVLTIGPYQVDHAL